MSDRKVITDAEDDVFDVSPEALRRAVEDGANNDPDSSASRLKSLIERVERLEEEKAGIATDIKELYAEAKGTGFDVKTMRQIVRLRKMGTADRVEQEELLDLYKRVLGMSI